MPGIGQEKRGHGQQPEYERNDVKRTGRKVPTGQPRTGHLTQPDAKEGETVGRINDGITNRGPVK